MSAGLLILIAGVYAYVAYDYWRKGQLGMAIAFICYALANIGFAIDLKRS